MAQLMLTESDYGWISHQLIELSKKHSDNRLVAALEGGYNTTALATSVLAYLQAYWD
jgi:acetoin utilization deacetylase AcuC-like enzyme